jgi:predicted nuclease of predicted toxin-antitoxin system
VRFLADMGVSQGVVEWLRSAGHDAIHLRDEELHRLPNGDIFQKGFVEHRAVLTFDLDFGEIVAASEGRVVSVVLFRLHNTRTGHVIERLFKPCWSNRARNCRREPSSSSKRGGTGFADFR